MDGMPPKEKLQEILREIVYLGWDVGPYSLSELKENYDFDPEILVNEGYLVHDPETKIHTITMKGLKESGEKPFVQTESPLYHLLEYLDNHGGKIRGDCINDEKKELLLLGAMGSGHVKFRPKKPTYVLTAKGGLTLSLGRGELQKG